MILVTTFVVLLQLSFVDLAVVLPFCFLLCTSHINTLAAVESLPPVDLILLSLFISIYSLFKSSHSLLCTLGPPLAAVAVVSRRLSPPFFCWRERSSRLAARVTSGDSGREVFRERLSSGLNVLVLPMVEVLAVGIRFVSSLFLHFFYNSAIFLFSLLLVWKLPYNYMSVRLSI